MDKMTKLYRSRKDKKLFGLCGGLAEVMNVDVTLLRLIAVVTTFFTGGLLIPIYLLAVLVVPNEPGFDTPAAGAWHAYQPSRCGAEPASRHFNTPPFTGYGTGGASRPEPGAGIGAQPTAASGLDSVMNDVERKAMWNEIQELKSKLSKYEKGDV